jgi:hypothetical protein
MWTSSTSFRRVQYPALHLGRAYTPEGMAEKPPKRKTNAKRGADGVLGTLPASRPERIGRPRATIAANGAPAKPRAKPAPRRAAKERPVAVTPGCPPLKVSRATDAPPPTPLGAPKGTELMSTSIRAAGELAQIGFVVGGRLLKRTIDRIPRP